jgi:hypothetical protein
MWIRAAPLKRRYFDEKVLGNGGCKNLCWYLCWYMTSTSKPKHYTATVSEHCLIDPTSTIYGFKAVIVVLKASNLAG